MEIKALRTFLTIVDAGTLTGAGDLLFKTQSAVSHELKKLEAEVGMQLIDRSGQRIVLTAAGATFHPHARALVSQADTLERFAARMRRNVSDHIRIGAVPSLAPYLVRPMNSFRASHPDARFLIFTELTPILHDWLQGGRIDMVLAHPALDSGFESTALGYESIYVILHSEDTRAEADELEASDLEGYPFIGFPRELHATGIAERFFAPLGTYPEPVVEVADFHILKQFVRARVGFGFVPASALVEDPARPLWLADSELVAVPPKPRLERDIALLRTGGQIPPLTVAFREHLATNWIGPVLPVRA